MSDDLTKPLIEKKGVTFSPNVDVRESLDTNGVISYHEKPYALDGPKTITEEKIKSTNIGTTRFGFSKTTQPFDKEEADNIEAAEKKMIEEDAELNLQKMRAKAHRLKYGDECDDGQSCCGDKCTILGGKKTKRRRYNKKQSKRQRSRKSRRSKKRSKNNKK
jgi:hypothetical protein